MSDLLHAIHHRNNPLHPGGSAKGNKKLERGAMTLSAQLDGFWDPSSAHNSPTTAPALTLTPQKVWRVARVSEKATGGQILVLETKVPSPSTTTTGESLMAGGKLHVEVDNQNVLHVCFSKRAPERSPFSRSRLRDSSSFLRVSSVDSEDLALADLAAIVPEGAKPSDFEIQEFSNASSSSSADDDTAISEVVSKETISGSADKKQTATTTNVHRTYRLPAYCDTRRTRIERKGNALRVFVPILTRTQ
eukprot:ANDGO_06930.mRNA.1 hypothetical protein